MIETMRSWLTGIICTAALVALAQAMTPKGTVKKIGMMVGGLVLMCVMIKPALNLDLTALSVALSQYRMEAEEASLILTEENQRQMEDIIAEETGAYIADKASALGIEAESKVDCAWSDDGVPYPAAITIWGTMDEEQKRALQKSVEAEFAIPTERQTYLAERG